MRSVLATVIVLIKLISFPYFRDICVTQKQKILQKLQTIKNMKVKVNYLIKTIHPLMKL